MNCSIFTIADKIWETARRLKAKDFIYRHDFRATVMLGLTYNCQCDCSHCAMKIYERNDKKELATDEIIGVINRLSKRKVKGIYFFGGEPLLHKDLLKLIYCAHRRGFTTFLDTNGYLLTKEMAKRLRIAGLNRIGISIDSSNYRIHDKKRNLKDCFKKAVIGIEDCLSEGIKCYMSVCANKENIKDGDLEGMISLGRRLRVDYVRIVSPILTGNWLRAGDLKLNSQEKRRLRSLCKKGFVYLEEDYCPSKSKKLVYISPYGEVQPCCFVPFVFGNVREEPLTKILKRMYSHPIFKIPTRECLMNNKEFRKKYLPNLSKSTKFPIKVGKQ